MKLPPLNALRAFECSARTGSFSAAGAELGVSSAAVSMQVKNLEDWLGLKLFTRRANRVRLTDAGRDYYQKAAVSLAEIASYTEALTEGGARRPLVISATPALAQLWLPERLKGFAALRPDVTVRLRIEDDRIDLVAEGIDARLTYGGEHPEHRTRELFSDRLVPVGADPQAKLGSAPLVEVAWGETIASVPGWRQYFAQHGMARPGLAAAIGQSVPSVVSLVQAGLGIALLPEQVVGGEIRAGRLHRLDGPALEMQRPYVLVTPHYKARSRRLRTLAEVLGVR
ncbi:LysR substrate-binding domain-containing protein [Leisingera sp. McT4-56]|uniref:LysR substrate-binding domain-containing protein n=1 Tax=Leisingera sp. McT4-56 TaxID=2881255 RepID=UPI001CF824B0|nr:LysR substrate-binding domain-containing protein [Leisingera sp. McT4-56]MCB4455245.1 LysR family transcriptional regulator [Leisingera sp. McT4-56]